MPNVIRHSDLLKKSMELNERLREERRKGVPFRGYYYEEIDGKMVLKHTDFEVKEDNIES